MVKTVRERELIGRMLRREKLTNTKEGAQSRRILQRTAICPAAVMTGGAETGMRAGIEDSVSNQSFSHVPSMTVTNQGKRERAYKDAPGPYSSKGLIKQTGQPRTKHVAGGIVVREGECETLNKGSAGVVQMGKSLRRYGRKGFGRPGFSKRVASGVTKGVNQERIILGKGTVLRKDHDVAHKVPFEELRKTVMDYVYDRGGTTEVELTSRTDVLYTQDKSRLGEMQTKRDRLIELTGKYGYLSKGKFKILDAANVLLDEINSASDNLGLGIQSENRSIGANPDPVIVDWNKKTLKRTLSSRSLAILTEFGLLNKILVDKKGAPRSSQRTSKQNL